jgi:cytochrome c oxidase cbb3-type subunit 1
MPSAAPVADPALPAPATVAEIDASCRLPLLFMFGSAALWLVAAGLLSLAASLSFHSPTLLSHCPWMTYGRVHPAHWNAFGYGFAAQAGMAVALWLLARLGRNPLGNPILLTFGAKLWNVGVTLGVFGILAGDTTGFEWMEMPRYAAGTLFFAYVIIGGTALFNLHERRERALYASQWYLLAALLWFPWIYSVANLMLVVSPVRGVMQSLVGWWFANNFVTLWLTPLALAVLFYLIPRQTGRPLNSHYVALFGFWTLAVFGGWGGVPVGAPLPGWISAVSTSAATLMAVPVLAVAVNLGSTMRDRDRTKDGIGLGFSRIALAGYAVAGLAGAVVAMPEVGRITQGTFVTPAIKFLLMYGFVGLALLGAIYHITPLLTGREFKTGPVKAHFAMVAGGAVLVFVLLVACGVKQGLALNHLTESKLTFGEISQGTLLFLRGSTLGEVVILLGNCLFAVTLFSLVGRHLWVQSGQLLGCTDCKAEVAK